jgi:DNA-binding response OmpR family regulator
MGISDTLTATGRLAVGRERFVPELRPCDVMPHDHVFNGGDGTVLIVDDSVDAQRLLRSLLRASGIQDVRTAGSFRDALACLNIDDASTPWVPVDLILLDIDMPEVDGIEACRRLKAHEAFRELPVIMVTANGEPQALASAFAAGAMDYMTKPFQPIELIARVRSALSLKRAVDARKTNERALTLKNQELERALREIQTLRGLIKICSYCKRVQNDQGVWQRIELYIREHSEAEFSHGICRECSTARYPGLLAQ